MARSSSPGSSNGKDYIEELQEFIAELTLQPDHESVASELDVLQSIYGDEAIRLWHPPTKESNYTRDPRVIRYEAVLNLPSPHEDVPVRVLVSLPPTYPVSSPPQLQLLSRYIGAFGADSSLFGSVLRTYISANGVEWVPDTVCVFDGLQNVLERCTSWYEDRLSAERAGELVRGDGKEHLDWRVESLEAEIREEASSHPPQAGLPDGIQIVTAEPITDRKSVFIGRACRISHPSQVPLIIAHLTSDRRIARAAHPAINAWRCQVGSLLHQDNDDDGETAAGGRLAHLLQILELPNVLVVVTRYFGGIHIGPDRFKHINQAARSALEVGGFLDNPDAKKSVGRGKKH